MKTWMIAYYTFIRNIRDVKAMLAFIVLPILMILIIGNALDSEFTPMRRKKNFCSTHRCGLRSAA